jgi:hypothetical protein
MNKNINNQARPIWHTTVSLFGDLRQITNRFVKRPSSNQYFKVVKSGDRVHIESTHRKDAHGCIEVNKDGVQELFQTVLGQSLKEDTHRWIKPSMLKYSHLGLGLNSILIRRETGLQLEMVHGGTGYINFGADKFEMSQILAFRDTKEQVMAMFDQIASEKAIRQADLVAAKKKVSWHLDLVGPGEQKVPHKNVNKPMPQAA